MDPTNVVLPTAKPPATTIFIVTGATGGRPRSSSRASRRSSRLWLRRARLT